MIALTRFTTWGNTRYFLPVFALTPFALYASLVRLRVAPILRRSTVAVVGGTATNEEGYILQRIFREALGSGSIAPNICAARPPRVMRRASVVFGR